MNKLKLIYSYYNNPEMLKCQLEEWRLYSEAVKEQLEIIIVDDCSETPISITWPQGIDGRVFRIKEKKNWNWIACRNIGANEANSEWIIVTDIDHVILENSMAGIFNLLNFLDKRVVYKFQRMDVYQGKMIEAHGNTFLMTRLLYWEIGGYDERLSGCYYGTVGTFRRRLMKISELSTLPISINWYTLELIKDAYTTSLEKNKERDFAINKRLDRRFGKLRTAKILRYQYEEIK